ncbi:OLC1v1030830C1, partial [Oldenlandia corymbosa var. corymbosa]
SAKVVFSGPKMMKIGEVWEEYERQIHESRGYEVKVYPTGGDFTESSRFMPWNFGGEPNPYEQFLHASLTPTL